MTPIREIDRVSPDIFADVRRAAEPVVMRGLVSDWPLVQAAREGQATAYLAGLANGEPVPFMRAAAEVEGRLHYAAGVEGRNFERQQGTVAEFLSLLEAEAAKTRPDVLALQGMPASQRLPEFAASHPMPLLPEAVPPRLWVGNAAKVAIHHDPTENIACVAAGRRRFTLFAPEQVSNLYMGPFHQTPAGVQVALPHLTDPDLDRYPRFAMALAAAMTAELEPGDALYIPYQWYHHVEALDPVNVLVNYWWDPAPGGFGSPWDAMMHAMMSVRSLPADQRRAWRAMFDHYVFETDGDPGEHLPETGRGALARPTPQTAAQMRRSLLKKLSEG
ncbi:peptidylprolyl isomerase [Brevundimonas sp. Leaf363]|uniref:cupin-like domain-containing protein n=1 Tax=Brevundimonas sp. Leaf363 TaxID=1736353 RepID=UPI0006F62D0A|nr:cupin-like domain-containing protein [Brevundimonas sp. Leaf363]KQS53883.1 peptidylprolyl isomerase [Brevundimonas sp. Leaf363]